MKVLKPITNDWQNLHTGYSELMRRDRWVCWKSVAGKKVPYSPKNLSRPIDICSEKNWSTYAEAEHSARQRSCVGIGFVLNGDGIVGIDIDGCVHDRCIDPLAMDIMTEAGCKLIEFSPSGTGLHGYGIGPALPVGLRGTYKGQSVELYSERRYLTITGMSVISEGIVELPGFDDLAAKMRLSSFTEATDTTDATETTESSGGHTGHLIEVDGLSIPPSCVPTKFGMRNKCIWNLVRHLKARFPTATADDLQGTVREWHRLSLPHIRTTDFTESWADFKVAWKKDPMPFGVVLDQVLNDLPDVPNALINQAYSGAMIHLIRICIGLQLRAKDDPFFLSCRKAGELIGLSHTAANAYLQLLELDGILSVVRRGIGVHATRYKCRLF